MPLLEYPEPFDCFFNNPKRYNVGEGGRGKGASWSIARKLIYESSRSKQRNLCTREYQTSIRDSVHRLLVDQINELRLNAKFDIYKDSIYGRKYGSEFIFKGLHNSITEIKSIEGVTRCWVEEAEKVSDYSWTVLIPTIRTEGSQFYISYNPEEEESATYQRFHVNPPPDSNIVFATYEDNPWFPEVLRREMEYDKRVDFEKYEHIWLGKIKKYGNALIFRGKFRVDTFETPSDSRFYFGADFGFSTDPTCLNRMFIKDRKLFIDWEAYGHGVELNDLHQFFSTVPEADKWQIIGDSARPDTISFLSHPFTAKNGTKFDGFRIIGAEKGKGSVEDGIQFLRSFEEIIIHTRCPSTARDFGNYKWKVDRITGDVIPMPAEGSDHSPDSARYGLERFIKRKVTLFDLA